MDRKHRLFSILYKNLHQIFNNPQIYIFYPSDKDNRQTNNSNKEEPIHKVMEYLSIPMKQRRNISCSSDFNVSEGIMTSSMEKSDGH